MTEKELLETLAETVDFGQRQRLMKQIWRLRKPTSRSESEPAKAASPAKKSASDQGNVSAAAAISS